MDHQAQQIEHEHEARLVKGAYRDAGNKKARQRRQIHYRLCVSCAYLPRQCRQGQNYQAANR